MEVFMRVIQWCVLISFLTMVSVTTSFAGENYKIGVLAKNGPVEALQMWKATGDYLTAKLTGKTFEVVPLDFDKVDPAIRASKVDFFVVNSSMFVTAKVKYGATAIATMVNSRQGQPLNSFGGVIITSAHNDKINTLADLKGKKFMAVENDSFGGWQMAYKTLLDFGVDPYTDFAKVEFGGKHDNVVFAVMKGAVDAGTVRTDTLERLAYNGKIDMGDFKIINRQKYYGFPFVCSTALYPEWPFAKVKRTPDAVARSVLDALKKMQTRDIAAKNAKVAGWVRALDYESVEDLQKTLKVGAFLASKASR
jgi:two-component system sensor histidine kinase TtrS